MAQTPERDQRAGDLGDVTWDAYARPGVRGRRARRRGSSTRISSRVVVPTAEQLDQVQQPHRAAVRTVDRTPRDDLDPADRGDRQRLDGGRGLGLRQGARDPAALPRSTGSGTAPTSTSPRTPTRCSRSSRRRRPASASSTPRRWPCWSASSASRRGSRSGTRPARSRTTARTWCRSKNAHAWVEVYFEGYGWLQFEPTPGHGTHPNAEPRHLPEPRQELDELRRDDHQPRRPEQPGRRGRSRMRRGGRPLAPGTPAPVSGREAAPARTEASSSRSRRSGRPGRRTGRGTRCRTG